MYIGYGGCVNRTSFFGGDLMVAIKDMEMPDSCNECRMKKRCEYGIAGGWREDKRVDGCPLVEIITCKDCDNWDKRHYRGESCYCGMRMRHTESDEFCENAIRRGEE